ncbi:hypothetical protein ACIPWF_18690 [Paenarthrobacter sp. NPDC089989]|uniref:hypothetical protein n=1 Tax=unclassified Paenarthrobacter TaxID=2634190 RepID=UPI0037FCD5D3
MQKRFKLRGASLEAIREKALQQYGPGARIVAAEKVTNPGIVGLFAAARFEATVEVGEAPADSAAPGPASVPLPAAAAGSTVAPGPAAAPGLAAAPGSAAAPLPADAHQLHGPAIASLLERADAAEIELHKPAPVSTASPDFAGLLEQLGKELETAPVVPAASAVLPSGVSSPALPPPAVPVGAGAVLPPSDAPSATVPQPLTGDGNLIVLLGLGDDALGPALEMSIAAGGSDVRTAGELSAFGHLHVQGRQSATAARAQAVLTGQSVVVAFGLGRVRDVPTQAAHLASLSADQLWVVVDAQRKAEDTKAWVQGLQSLLAAQSTPPADPAGIAALAVIGASETATPETVDSLGIPVGWVDGKPASTPALGKVH